MKKMFVTLAAFTTVFAASADLAVNFQNSNVALSSDGANTGFVSDGSLVQLIYSTSGPVQSSGQYAVGASSLLAGETLLGSGTTRNGVGFYGPETITTAGDFSGGVFFLRAFTGTGQDGESFRDFDAVTGGAWIYSATDPSSVYSDNLTGLTGGSIADLSANGTTVIPEPATIGLLGIAGAGLFAARRKTQA